MPAKKTAEANYCLSCFKERMLDSFLDAGRLGAEEDVYE